MRLLNFMSFANIQR